MKKIMLLGIIFIGSSLYAMMPKETALRYIKKELAQSEEGRQFLQDRFTAASQQFQILLQELKCAEEKYKAFLPFYTQKMRATEDVTTRQAYAYLAQESALRLRRFQEGVGDTLAVLRETCEEMEALTSIEEEIEVATSGGLDEE